MRARRHRIPSVQLLRRLLHIDALACPRCSTPGQSVPMMVLAFLTDPDVVGRVLRHLRLPTCAPALAPAGSFPCQQFLVQLALSFLSPALACTWSEDGDVSGSGEDEEGSAPAASRRRSTSGSCWRYWSGGGSTSGPSIPVREVGFLHPRTAPPCLDLLLDRETVLQ